MKAVILAGGLGSRISEESKIKPKPMIEIGGKPILWHIMKIYAHYGVTDFIICCGYKGHIIKEYFVNYYKYQANMKFYLQTGMEKIIDYIVEPWKVTMVNTGAKTLTAERILKVRNYIGEAPFFLTYGDGVADIDLNQLMKFHEKNKKVLTISVTQPEGRFGTIQINSETKEIESFAEKARRDQSWVNMGFMVAEPGIFDFLGKTMLEDEPFAKLVENRQMDAYQHMGFWSPMDTMKDKEYLEKLWSQDRALWKKW